MRPWPNFSAWALVQTGGLKNMTFLVEFSQSGPQQDWPAHWRRNSVETEPNLLSIVHPSCGVDLNFMKNLLFVFFFVGTGH